MLVPALLIRRATEAVAASGLRDAPVRPVRLAPPRPGLRRFVTRRLLRRRLRGLLGELLAERAEWHVATAQGAESLRRWVSAPPSERATAFAAYRAALDREDAAERELRRVLRRAESACEGRRQG